MRRSIPLARVWREPALLLATGFGVGCTRFAPGTWGTLIAVPFCWLALSALPPALYGLLTLALFGLGVWICHRASYSLGIHDHPGIVWDEVVGYFITMVAAPADWHWLALGFVLFRLFDIGKPWPISVADRQLTGGFGIMADDVLAAVYAWVCLQLLIAVFGA